MWYIFGVYNGQTDIIDQVSSEREARYLVSKYRMAYGQGWSIYSEYFKDESEEEVTASDED